MKERKLISKTYLVKGLMEWQLELPTGYEARPFITVNFTGGQLTGYGVSPARFSTGDPFIQRLIENTEWFRSGRIYLSGK